MSSNDSKFGSLKIYKARGEATQINLSNTTYSIGSDVQANLMLRIEGVEPLHCEIHVTNDGLATLHNKAKHKPVPINGKKVPSLMYLMSNDTFTVMGKEFKYENQNLSPELIEKAKKTNLAFLRKWSRQSVGAVSLTPQPLSKGQVRFRRSNSVDNANMTGKKNKFDKGSMENVHEFGVTVFPSKPTSSQQLKGFTVSTPEGIKPTSRNALMLSMCQVNYKEPECEEPAPLSRDKARTPVQFETDNDVSTPLNNESVVLIGTPEEERPSLRSVKTRAKDNSLQRLTANDDSSPDSKTPKSALKADKKQTPKSCLRRSKKLADEFLQLSNKQLAPDGSSVNGDSDTGSKPMVDDYTSDENLKPAEVCEETFCETPAKRRVHFTDETLNLSNSEDFINSLPASSTPFKGTDQNEQVEDFINNEELSDDSDAECDVVIGIKRKRVSYSSEDDACMKRQKKDRDTDFSDIHSFNISEHHTQHEENSSALSETDDNLNISTDSVPAPLEDSQDSNNSNEILARRSSRSVNLPNESTEDIVVDGSTLESVDTSSIIYSKHNVSFENTNFSPLKSNEEKNSETKIIDASPPSTNKSMVVSLTPEKNGSMDRVFKTPLTLNESGIEALQYDEDDIFPKKPSIRTYERTPKKSLNTSLSNQSKVAEWVEKTTPLTVKSGDDTFQFDDPSDDVVDDQPTFISDDNETDDVESVPRRSRIRGRYSSSKSTEQLQKDQSKTVNTLLNINEFSESEECETLNLEVEDTSSVKDDAKEQQISDQDLGTIEKADNSFSEQKRPSSMNRSVQLPSTTPSSSRSRRKTVGTVHSKQTIVDSPTVSTAESLSQHSNVNEADILNNCKIDSKVSSEIIKNTDGDVHKGKDETEDTDVTHSVPDQTLVLTDLITEDHEQKINDSVVDEYAEKQTIASPIVTNRRSLRKSSKNTNVDETIATGKRRGGLSLYTTKKGNNIKQFRKTIGSLPDINTTRTEIVNKLNAEKTIETVEEDIYALDIEDRPEPETEDEAKKETDIKQKDKNNLTGARENSRTPKANKRPKNGLGDLESVKEVTPQLVEKKSKLHDFLDKNSSPKTRRNSRSKSLILSNTNTKASSNNRRKTIVAIHLPNVELTDKTSEPLDRVAALSTEIDFAKVTVNSSENNAYLSTTEMCTTNGAHETPSVESELPDVKENVPERKSLQPKPRIRSLLKQSMPETQGSHIQDKEDEVLPNVNTYIELPITESNVVNSQVKRRTKRQAKTSKTVQNEVKNDLTDVRGVKQLMATPKHQTPKNDLSDLRGVKALLTTPKVQKPPKNDLSNVEGIQELFETPQSAEKINTYFTEKKGKLRAPKVQKKPENDLSNATDEDVLLKTPSTEATEQIAKSRTRSQRKTRRNVDQQLLEANENENSTEIVNDSLVETSSVRTTRSRKRKNAEDSQAIQSKTKVTSTRSQRNKKNTADDTNENKETTENMTLEASDVKPRVTRAKKNIASQNKEPVVTVDTNAEEVADKAPSRGRRMKKVEEESSTVDTAVEETAEKPVTRGRRGKKVIESATDLDNPVKDTQVEKPRSTKGTSKMIKADNAIIDDEAVEANSNGPSTRRRAKNSKETQDDIQELDVPAKKPAASSKRAKNAKNENNNTKIEEALPLKAAPRTRKTKKDSEQTNTQLTEEENENANESAEIVKTKPSTRSKATKNASHEEKAGKKGNKRDSSPAKKVDSATEDSSVLETITETKRVSGVPITKIISKKVCFPTVDALLATPKDASKKRRLRTEEEINTSIDLGAPGLRRSARRH